MLGLGFELGLGLGFLGFFIKLMRTWNVAKPFPFINWSNIKLL